MQGLRVRLWVLDTAINANIGFSGTDPVKTAPTADSIAQNRLVGWLCSPVERLTRNAGISSNQQQQHASWLIVALSTLLAIIALTG
ncbi:hypothetical protein MQE23_00055 [Streptomyces sp. HP-A2021]|uniref:hypothetical protein n=1 Tax=Streptomyces sp. HP-A2021 TaxID=2927875 RepID=UPI001FB024D2|nr:hypothetical protein [Streptomyces sp. HP-A2021]UOB07604.1 hypothetical protein MQE23_00055 [Streptomyces sp. HP-A2021]